MRYSQLLILFCYYLYGCGVHCDCASVKHGKLDSTLFIQPYTTNFKIGHLISSFDKEEKANYFRFKLVQRKEKIYGMYVSTENNLRFINLFDSTDVHSSSFTFFSTQHTSFLYDYFDDTIHLIDVKGGKYYRVAVAEDFSLTILNSIDLNKIVHIPHWYVSTNTSGVQLAYSFPYLVFPYGKGVASPKNSSHIFLHESASLVSMMREV